jgi:hypothetical protein
MVIKEIYTISNDSLVTFNSQVKKIVEDLQSDGLKTEVQFSTATRNNLYTTYSAMIIGKSFS